MSPMFILPPLAHLSFFHTPEAVAATAPVIARSKQVPFYSQFRDISSPQWQKVGCGIASLAMIVNYYRPSAVSVNTLLTQGIKAGAYTPGGWSHMGLVGLSKKYGLGGIPYDFSGLTSAAAVQKLRTTVADGPVIASVHYKLEPTNPIPHMVVVTSIKGDTLYYNDPANKAGETSVSVATFAKAWKQRYIVIRPASASLATAS